MTKRAFTLMEMIFVIVILGVLAMVVIPRLATTRDDAKVAFCAKNITLFMRDLSNYYTSQGNFSLNIREMSNVEVYETTPITRNGSSGEYYYVCNKSKEEITSSDAAIIFKFSNIIDGSGNTQIVFNATMASIQQGTVDGDLGFLLEKKHVATDGSGINHFLVGLRIKR